MTDILKDYALKIEIPVAWGEMDAFQHVNNTAYFRYFESARIAYFEKIDYMRIMNETGIGPILASTSCQFKYPVTYPDTVTVACRVSDLQTDRFTMDYVAFSQAANRVAAEGQGVIVSYDYNRKQKSPLPDEVRQRIEEFEKH